MSSIIESLPVELLSKILRKARNNCTINDYAKILTVCEAFHKAGKEYTFETIKIDYDSTKTFGDQIEANPSKFSKTKALFVRFQLDWPQSTDTSDIGALLKEWNDSVGLAITIVKLGLQTEAFKSLKTFSLIVTRFRVENPAVFRSSQLRAEAAKRFSSTLDGAVIRDIVAALPTTVVNLEIDTNGLDRFDTQNEPATEPHLCGEIRSILPRLRSCRLRLATLCQEFFLDNQGVVVKADYLRSLTINFSISRCDLNPRHDVTKSTCECPKRRAVSSVLDYSRSQQMYRPHLERKMKQAAKAWGSIKRLETYFTNYAREARVPNSVYRFATNHWDINNLLAGNTTIVPAYILGYQTIIGRTRFDWLLVGPFDAFEEIVEGSWFTTLDGGRYPQAFILDGHAREMGLKWKAPRVSKFVDWRPFWREAANRRKEKNASTAAAIAEKERFINDADLVHVMRFETRDD